MGNVDREVIVPNQLYKSIVVISTAFSILTIVIGFILLDMATQRATTPLSQIDPLFASIGLSLIGLGTIVYAFATRFKTQGMAMTKGDEN